MIVGPPHGYRKVVARCPCSAHKMERILSSHRASIARRPHDDRAAAIRFGIFESAGVSALCCILFYMFEVQSQLKMISCTRLINEMLKVHEDHTAIERSPHGLRTRVSRSSCDIHAISMYRCGDSTMTARSPYDLRTFCLRLCTGPL